MTSENVNTDVITIDDKEYTVADMTAEQQYILRQLRSLNTKKSNIQFELDQLNAASTAFSNTLMSSVKEAEKSEDTEGAKSE